MSPHGNELLPSLSGQLLGKNPALAPYILETFANNGQKPLTKSLRAILEKLLLSLPYVRIIIDGIDECSLPDQDGILDDLHELEQIMPKSYKILFSARKTSLIMKRFHSKPALRLEDHAEDMKGTIATLVESRLDHTFEAMYDTLLREFSIKIYVETSMSVSGYIKFKRFLSLIFY